MMPDSPSREVAPLTEAQKITAEELIERAMRIPAVRDHVELHGSTEFATSYRDESRPVPTGAQPVVQDDKRIVPQWAAGVAVAGAGIGLMSVCIGLGAKLVFDSVTTEGVVMVSVMVAGTVTFVGVLGRLVRRVSGALSPVTNHIHGDVSVDRSTHSHLELEARSFGRNKIVDKRKK